MSSPDRTLFQYKFITAVRTSGKKLISFISTRASQAINITLWTSLCYYANLSTLQDCKNRTNCNYSECLTNTTAHTYGYRSEQTPNCNYLTLTGERRHKSCSLLKRPVL